MQFGVGAESETKTVKGELSETKKDRDNLKHHLDQCRTSHSELERRLQEESHRSAQKDAEILRFRTEAQNLQNENNVRANTFDIQFKSASDRNRELEAKIELMKKENETKDENIRNLHDQLSSSVVDRQQQDAGIDTKIWKNRIEGLLQDVARLNAEKASLETAGESLRRDGQTSWDENAVLNAELKQLKIHLDEITRDKNDCWKQHGDKDREIVELKKKISKLESVISDEKLRREQVDFELSDRAVT